MLRGYQSFDQLPVNQLPVGWSNGVGGNYIVISGNRPVSGSNTLGQSVPTEGLVAVWTAVASVAGNIAAQFAKIITVSGNTSNAANLMICSDAAGTTGYIAALVYNAGWVLQFFKSPGSSAWAFITQQAAGFTPVDGATIYKKFDQVIVGGVGTIKCKVWTGTPADEPATWNVTFTDNSPVACKYVGVFAGINGGGVLVNADDFYIGDSGDSFNFKLIPPTDLNLYFSHRNTQSDGTGAMQTNNVRGGSTYARGLTPGSYVKGGVSNTTQCYMLLDTTNLASASPGDCPRLNIKVDETVSTSNVQLVAGSTIVPVATGLSTAAHTFRVTYTDSNPNIDQWNTPIGMKCIGFLVDPAGVSSPPALLPKRLTYHTDSIGRGYCTDGGGNNGGNAMHTVPWYLAAALNAELGLVAYGRLGWGMTGQGNVPAFFVPGNDAASSWNKMINGVSALINGLESPMPDILVAQFGTNCYLNGIPDATVTASVAGWIPAQLAAFTGQLWIVLPYGGFKKSAIIAGFIQYAGTYSKFAVGNGLATLYVAGNNSNVLMLDLGSDVATGLMDTGQTDEAPFDGGAGIHPSGYRNAHIATQQAAAMSGQPTNGVFTAIQALAAQVIPLIPNQFGVISNASLTNLATTTGGTSIPITVFQSTQANLSFKVVNSNNAPINLAGHTVNFIIHDTNTDTIESTTACTLAQSDSVGNPGVYDTVVVSIPPATVATAGNFSYKVRDTTANAIYASGPFDVNVAP